MLHDNTAGHGEAHPDPVRLGGIERVEDVGNIFRRDPDALSRDADQRFIVLLNDSNGDSDFILNTEFNGIEQQH